MYKHATLLKFCPTDDNIKNMHMYVHADISDKFKDVLPDYKHK